MNAFLDRRRGRALVVGGPLAAVALAAALIPVRDEVGNSNVALALAFVVVSVGALGGRVPAAVTSLFAAGVFNVWHTRPYLSFKIDSRTDIITTSMLLVLGIVAGLVTEHGWRQRDRAQFRAGQVEQLHRIAELAVAADNASAVWPTVRDTLCQELHLGSCWFEPDGPEGLAFTELMHSGTLQPTRDPVKASPAGYELPRNGVELAVTGAGRRLGRLVMLPNPGHALSLVDRRFAVAIANQFALVALRTPDLGQLW